MSVSEQGASPRPDRWAPPTGIVTFLFTDIEGSTQRWDRDHAAMQAAVLRHDTILRDTIVAHAGYVFKTIGDAFCAAFTRPVDAAHAAIAAQRALAATDFNAVDGIRVRMAVHSGTTDERDGDYFGAAVNRVARLLAIGHGGQTLVSGVSADLMRGAIDARSSLLGLGEHRLKDLSRPEYVYQLIAPDLPIAFPPLRSLDTMPNNLPMQLTSFVGRENEVAEIARLVAQHRLVTLVGSGGIGKTRTSLQVAANLLDGRGDGVWFVELAPLSSGDYIPSTIAMTLGRKLPVDGEPIENLVRLLREMRVLLVFDNCEHIIEATARVVSALIRGCPDVRVLASSRQRLGIGGETAYRLPSLSVPVPERRALLRAADALTYSSIALFVTRAQAADAAFALTDENAAIVADICRRLDGIALAIELAASRITILRPQALRDKLDERFRILTGGSRDTLPRQQTLRALIDWSYDLLDERERTLFRRLSIFADGFTIEGASAIGCDETVDEFDVLDLVTSLVDKSLLLADPSPNEEADTLRFRMLESTRAYAAEKLEHTGERERTGRLHLQYFHDLFFAHMERAETTANRSESDLELTIQLQDVRAALAFALQADLSLGANLLDATSGSSWRSLGLGQERVLRSETYLAKLGPGENRLRARLWNAIAYLVSDAGYSAKSIDAASRALEHARASRDDMTIVAVLNGYANALGRSRRFDESEAALAEAESYAAISTRARVSLLEARATLCSLTGDLEAAIRNDERLLLEYRRLGLDEPTRNTVLNLAESYHALHDTPHAIELIRGLLPDVRSAADRSILQHALANFALYLAASNAFAEADGVAREVIAMVAPTMPSSPRIAVMLEAIALGLAARGEFESAARLAGFADAAVNRTGFEREYSEANTSDRLRAILDASLAPKDQARLRAEGAALPDDAGSRLAGDDAGCERP